MIYCDTSLLGSALTQESASDIAVRFLDRQAAGTLAISGWSLTEFASAIAMKEAHGDLDEREAALVERGWLGLQARLELLSVTEGMFARSAKLVDSPTSRLRAGDALHPAVVLEHGCALATFDNDLASVAGTLGVAVHPAS